MTDNSSHRSYDELFIGGQWRKPASPQQLAVISPHSEEPIGHVQVAGPEDVDAAFPAGRRRGTRWTTAGGREWLTPIGWPRSKSWPRSMPATSTRWPT